MRLRVVFLMTAAFAMGLVASLHAEPQVPLLEMWVDPPWLVVEQPCPTTAIVTLNIRNNALAGAAATVDWTSAWVRHDLACVADYDPKASLPAGVQVNPQQTVQVTITLSFIGACEGVAIIEFQGTIRGSNPQDADRARLGVGCVGDCINLDGPDHYTDPNPNPNDLLSDDCEWGIPWHAWPLPGGGIPLNSGSTVAIGMDNGTDVDRIKWLTMSVTFTAANAGDLDVIGTGAHWEFARGLGGPDVSRQPTDLAGQFVLTFSAVYDPQPECEWVLLQANANGVTITAVDATTSCCPSALPAGQVPSLTQWGLLALGALILAAGAMVIIRRRKAVATA